MSRRSAVMTLRSIRFSSGRRSISTSPLRKWSIFCNVPQRSRGASHRFVWVPSPWVNRGFSTVAARPRIGCSARSCRAVIQKCAWRWTESSSQIWTSAGMTAGIDLALGLVERDLGPGKAREIARMMVLHHRRAGGQSQHSALLDIEARSDRVQATLQYARRNLSSNLSVERLAAVACLSPRQFSRLFRLETGLSPAKAVENLRLEAARFLLEHGRLPIETIAFDTGFGDRERMRRAFLRACRQTPVSIRNAANVLAAI